MPQPKPGPSDLEQVRQSKRGSNGQRKHSIQTGFLSKRRQVSARGECICIQTMASDVNLCISPDTANSTAAGACTGRTVEGNVDHPRTHGRSMVSSVPTAEERTTETALAGGCALTGGGRNQELPGDRTAPLGLATKRECLERLGSSLDVVCMIQSARTASTKACYVAKWATFQKLCLERDVDPTSCPLSYVLSFLQLLDRNLAFSTIKTCTTAISSYHEGFTNRTVFNHPLMKCFLKGAHRQRPVSCRLLSQWALVLVLYTLSKDPLEPLDQVSLKNLSFKTALLLALMSAKRVSNLSALLVAPSCQNPGQ